MNPKHIKIVGFDCDGVMFDSTEANKAYYNHILAGLNLPAMTQAQFAFAHMQTVDETLAHLISDEALLAAAQAYRRTISYLPFIRFMRIEPHLRELIGKLRPGYKTAIATNRTDTMAHVLAEHALEGAFDMVVTAGDVRRPKPHPEPLLKILAHFNAQPGQMLFIGDSQLDAMAAEQAGVPFLAYANPTLAAYAHIDSLERIGGILNL